MKLEDKIEELNKAVDGTLSITYYVTKWQISSYKKRSLFYPSNWRLEAESLVELIDTAIEYKREKEKTIREKRRRLYES
jgi:hypothetical protein